MDQADKDRFDGSSKNDDKEMWDALLETINPPINAEIKNTIMEHLFTYDKNAHRKGSNLLSAGEPSNGMSTIAKSLKR